MSTDTQPQRTDYGPIHMSRRESTPRVRNVTVSLAPRLQVAMEAEAQRLHAGKRPASALARYIDDIVTAHAWRVLYGGVSVPDLEALDTLTDTQRAALARIADALTPEALAELLKRERES